MLHTWDGFLWSHSSRLWAEGGSWWLGESIFWRYKKSQLILFCFPQVPVLIRDQDTFQEGMSTTGTTLHTPTGSPLSAEFCPYAFTDPVVFNLQDPQHGTYSVALCLDFLRTFTVAHLPLFPDRCLLSCPVYESFMVPSSFCYSPSFSPGFLWPFIHSYCYSLCYSSPAYVGHSEKVCRSFHSHLCLWWEFWVFLNSLFVEDIRLEE